eukprot:TRINITY_DN41117_c0_g1_i1.p1 TRINITY_DN41117_c0_g1~~TRINITY_DN41117_c0_g1_i1.p1  ORF type:complete len:119 (+),score=26.57 TRINITY_DN41117_c0_g1_i1:155-511(+)
MQMLTGQMKEADSGQITIRETEPHAVQDLVKFAYTGDIPEDSEKIMHLLVLADQYQMAHLVCRCAECLLDDLREDNFIPMIRAVRNHKDDDNVKDVWRRILELLAVRGDLQTALAMNA